MLYSAGQYDSCRSHGCSKPHLNPLGCFGGPEGGFYSESLGQGWNFPPKSLMSSAFRTDRRTRFISVVPSRFGEAENFLQMKGEQARRRMMGPPTPSDESERGSERGRTDHHIFQAHATLAFTHGSGGIQNSREFLLNEFGKISLPACSFGRMMIEGERLNRKTILWS